MEGRVRGGEPGAGRRVGRAGVRVPKDVLERAFTVAVLALMTGAVMPLLRMGGAAATEVVEGDPVQQAVWTGVYACTGLLILLRWRAVMRMIVANWTLWPIVLMAVASAIWADHPAVTMRKSVALLGTTAFGLYFAVRFPLNQQVRLLGWVFGILAVLSVGAALFVPEYGIDHVWSPGAWQGVFIQKNALGKAMVVGVVAFMVLAGVVARRWVWVPLCGMVGCAFLILMSTSKTALLLSVTLVVLYALIRARRRIQSGLLVPFAIATVLLGVGAALLVAMNAEAAAGALGRDVTLTGRTALWTVVTGYISQRPLLGHGYGDFWITASPPISQLLGWKVPHAHNGLLDLALDLGILGALLLLWAFALGLGRSYHLAVRGTSAAARWPLMMMLVTVLYNTTESTLLVRNSIYWVLFVAALAAAAQARRDPAAALAQGRGGPRPRTARSRPLHPAPPRRDRRRPAPVGTAGGMRETGAPADGG
jgi:exopolysaccharide production protein ExoQ